MEEEPATASEAVEATPPRLEVMEAIAPEAEEDPPPMVIPEVAEVKEAPTPVADPDADRLNHELSCLIDDITAHVAVTDSVSEETCPQASSSCPMSCWACWN